MERIDAEVRAIIDRNYETAAALLEENRDVLDAMAQALVNHETLDSEQIGVLMARGTLPEPDRGDDSPPDDGSGASLQKPSSSGVARPAAQHCAADDPRGEGRRL